MDPNASKLVVGPYASAHPPPLSPRGSSTGVMQRDPPTAWGPLPGAGGKAREIKVLSEQNMAEELTEEEAEMELAELKKEYEAKKAALREQKEARLREEQRHREAQRASGQQVASPMPQPPSTSSLSKGRLTRLGAIAWMPASPRELP